MSSREFTEWMAFYKHDPFGAARTDLNTAMIAAVIVNAHLGADQDAVEIDNFLLNYGEQQFKRDPDEAAFDEFEPIGPERGAALLATLNAMFGGKDLRKVH